MRAIHCIAPMRVKCVSILGQKSFSILKPSRHDEFLSLVRDHGAGDISLRIDNSLAQIVISNPDKRNAISGRMMNQLSSIVKHLSSPNVNKDISGLIITGSSGMFCAGADFTLIKNVVNTPAKGVLMLKFMTEILASIKALPMISVSVLEGPALGGGAEFSTCTDYRLFSSSNAYIQFVHARIGLTPGWGGGMRLLSIVGRQHCLRLVASSSKVSLEEAFRIGLIDNNTISPSLPTLTLDQNHANAVEMGKQFLTPFLTQKYPKSIRAFKRIVAAADISEEYGRLAELQQFEERWCSDDNLDALQHK